MLTCESVWSSTRWDVPQTAVTCKPWPEAPCCPAVLLPQCRSLPPAPLALQSWLVSSEYGKGTKAAFIAGWTCRPDVRDPASADLPNGGEAAPAPNSLISARQREREKEGGLRQARGHCRALRVQSVAWLDLGLIPNTPNLKTGSRVSTLTGKLWGNVRRCLCLFCVYSWRLSFSS